jgi:serine/threonine protein kinase
METHIQPLRIGPFTLVRPLLPGPLAERWLALNEPAHSAHVAHRFRMRDRAEERRLVSALEAAGALAHPHILPIEQFTLGIAGAAWVVTPFTGSHDGLVTLTRLLKDKGGRMEPIEVERVMVQLLEASEYAHSAGVQHGEISMDEIVVDRRGSLAIEHYGVRRRLTSALGLASELAADEVRSLIGIGYTLLTGLPADEPRIAAARIVPRLDRPTRGPARGGWDQWLEDGLDPLLGYTSAGEALGALPGMGREVEGRAGPVVGVLTRMRRALGAM